MNWRRLPITSRVKVQVVDEGVVRGEGGIKVHVGCLCALGRLRLEIYPCVCRRRRVGLGEPALAELAKLLLQSLLSHMWQVANRPRR